MSAVIDTASLFNQRRAFPGAPSFFYDHFPPRLSSSHHR